MTRMTKMIGGLFLIAGTASAQTKPLQLFPPRSTQNGVTKQALDAAKLPLKITMVPRVANCAIPLRNVAVPADKNFTVKRVIPSTSTDPKIVVKPPLPACAARP